MVQGQPGKVLVFGSTAGRLTDAQVAEIRATAGDVVIHIDSAGAIDENIDAAEILAVPPGQVTRERLRRARRLRWIHLWAAGVDSAMLPELRTNDILVTSSKGNGAAPL